MLKFLETLASPVLGIKSLFQSVNIVLGGMIFVFSHLHLLLAITKSACPRNPHIRSIIDTLEDNFEITSGKCILVVLTFKPMTSNDVF